jgi:hypothetical protein
MSLLKEQRILNTLKENKNNKVIQVITTNQNFEERFDGSISLFFRSLKNGLYSFNGVSNREYFKGISGVYFSLEEVDKFEIIIVYDTTVKTLNQTQVITRLRKLLGFNIDVKFGLLEEYERRIREMLGIKRRTQSFGDHYFNNKK